MSPLEDFQAIVAARNTAYQQLADYEKILLTQSNALINKKNRGDPLTADESADLTTIDTSLDAVHHSMWIVGQVSLQAMNDSALLRDIKNGLTGASGDLKVAGAKLKTIAGIAQTSADVAKVLVALAEKAGEAMA